MSQLERLNSALAKRPGDPFILYAIAMEYLKISETDTCLDHFRKLILSHPDYIPTYLQYGMALADNDQPDKAREILEIGIIVAKNAGEMHAASEMQGALSSLDS